MLADIYSFSGKVWIKQMMMSAFFIPSFICGTAFVINFIAIYYHASRAIPFGTMASITNYCNHLHWQFDCYQNKWLPLHPIRITMSMDLIHVFLIMDRRIKTISFTVQLCLTWQCIHINMDKCKLYIISNTANSQ